MAKTKTKHEEESSDNSSQRKVITSFDDVDIIQTYNVADIPEGTKLEVVRDSNNGVLIESTFQNKDDDDEVTSTSKSYSLSVKPEKMMKGYIRLNNKNLVTVKAVCKGNPEKLEGCVFKVMKTGSGKFVSMVLASMD